MKNNSFHRTTSCMTFDNGDFWFCFPKSPKKKRLFMYFLLLGKLWKTLGCQEGKKCFFDCFFNGFILLLIYFMLDGEKICIFGN